MLLYLKTPETPVTPPDIVATWLETTPAAFNYNPFGYGYGYQNTAFRSASINETGSVTALSVYPTEGLALRNAAGVMTYIPLDHSVWMLALNRDGTRLITCGYGTSLINCYDVTNNGTALTLRWTYTLANANDVSVTRNNVYVLALAKSVKLDWDGKLVKEFADTTGRTIAANENFVAIGNASNLRLYDTAFNLVATRAESCACLHLAKDANRLFVGDNVVGTYTGSAKTTTVNGAGFGTWASCAPLNSSGWSELGFAIDSTYGGNVMLTASKECEYVSGAGLNHGDMQVWLFDGVKFNLETRVAQGVTVASAALGTGLAIAGNGTLAVARRLNGFVFIVPNV